MKEPLLTAEEVGQFLRLKTRTVTEMAKRGEIPAIKIGGYWRFQRSDIERLIAPTSAPAKSDNQDLGASE